MPAQTITPAAALPTVTDPVVIDGYSQTGAVMNTDANGFNGTLLIELNGTSAGANGLTFARISKPPDYSAGKSACCSPVANLLN